MLSLSFQRRLKAVSGAYSVALAAKHYSVPVSVDASPEIEFNVNSIK